VTVVAAREADAVLSENSIEPSRGSMLVAEEAALSRAEPNGTDRTGRGAPGRNERIVQAHAIQSSTVKIQIAALLLVLCTGPVMTQQQTLAQGDAAFRALYRELIEINTTLSVGNCTAAPKAAGHTA
jgi:hypothetical protein